MQANATIVRVEHSQVVHWVQTTRASRAAPPERGGESETPCAAEPQRVRRSEHTYTLLDLIEAIADVTDDEREIVATVIHLLASGQVRLGGNFRDEPIELILAS